ncbi:unnamed protein product [Caenorhabditis angaria]|uniref:Large ribosomal subunit protein bL36m n=1 Tax=Caenorhabditis angaria TaxID=860376 RepID=A0A9P1MXV7_9PELO|nr:unnamed protein product [Caenorhabditis angaria]
MSGVISRTMMQGNSILRGFLKAQTPISQEVAGFKVKSRLKLRCRSCFFLRVDGRLHVECNENPRHKARELFLSRQTEIKLPKKKGFYNIKMYITALFFAVAILISSLNCEACVNAECRQISNEAAVEDVFQRFLADRQKMKRDYDFVRFGRSSPPAKKASYDYIRFGRK